MMYVEGAGNIRHGDSWTWCPALWKYMVDRYAIKSVLDVGCGEGHAVNYFRSLGCITHGIDASMDNVQRAVTPIQLFNIKDGSYVYPVDLVWCSEVLEHISEEYITNILNVLSNGRMIALTAATPGQGGHGHVNEQTNEYWIDYLINRGYTFSRDNTEDLREYCKEKDFKGNNNWFPRNGLVFFRND